MTGSRVCIALQTSSAVNNMHCEWKKNVSSGNPTQIQTKHMNISLPPSLYPSPSPCLFHSLCGGESEKEIWLSFAVKEPQKEHVTNSNVILLLVKHTHTHTHTHTDTNPHLHSTWTYTSTQGEQERGKDPGAAVWPL